MNWYYHLARKVLVLNPNHRLFGHDLESSQENIYIGLDPFAQHNNITCLWMPWSFDGYFIEAMTVNWTKSKNLLDSYPLTEA